MTPLKEAHILVGENWELHVQFHSWVHQDSGRIMLYRRDDEGGSTIVASIPSHAMVLIKEVK